MVWLLEPLLSPDGGDFHFSRLHLGVTDDKGTRQDLHQAIARSPREPQQHGKQSASQPQQLTRMATGGTKVDVGFDPCISARVGLLVHLLNHFATGPNLASASLQSHRNCSKVFLNR